MQLINNHPYLTLLAFWIIINAITNIVRTIAWRNRPQCHCAYDEENYE